MMLFVWDDEEDEDDEGRRYDILGILIAWHPSIAHAHAHTVRRTANGERRTANGELVRDSP